MSWCDIRWSRTTSRTVNNSRAALLFSALSCLAADHVNRYIDSQLTGVKDLVCNGLVTKTVGASSKQRVLVLTETPHLVYMVPDTGEIKGEIEWGDTVYAKLVEGTRDHFKVRTYIALSLIHI